MDLDQMPARPGEVLTWETRIEPTIMASLAQWFDKNGARASSKSQLLRLTAFTLMDVLSKISDLEIIDSVPQAIETLHRLGLVDKESPRSLSTKRATAVQQALARADGMGFSLQPKFTKPARSEVNYAETREERIQRIMQEIEATEDEA